MTLQDRFKQELSPLVELTILDGNNAELRKALNAWVQKFDCLEESVGPSFNCWDEEDTANRIHNDHGWGWTMQMLDFCRRGDQANFIATEGRSKFQARTDFALIARELNLTISARNNLFFPDTQNSINPDGLGVKKDGTFCIVEVKVESDPFHSLRDVTLQSLCGALAVYAKRKTILRKAQKKCGRRPAVPNAVIPDNERSLGLYIMVAKSKFQWRPELSQSVTAILDACCLLREIAYFSVAPETTLGFGFIPVEHVLRFDGPNGSA